MTDIRKELERHNDNVDIAKAFLRAKEYSEAQAFLMQIAVTESPMASAARARVMEALNQEVGKAWEDIFRYVLKDKPATPTGDS